MTKQELIQAAKTIKKHCASMDGCENCFFRVKDPSCYLCELVDMDNAPMYWDIERLERESNENKMG